jgi:hypothetical protein
VLTQSLGNCCESLRWKGLTTLPHPATQHKRHSSSIAAGHLRWHFRSCWCSCGHCLAAAAAALPGWCLGCFDWPRQERCLEEGTKQDITLKAGWQTVGSGTEIRALVCLSMHLCCVFAAAAAERLAAVVHSAMCSLLTRQRRHPFAGIF